MPSACGGGGAGIREKWAGKHDLAELKRAMWDVEAFVFAVNREVRPRFQIWRGSLDILHRILYMSLNIVYMFDIYLL